MPKKLEIIKGNTSNTELLRNQMVKICECILKVKQNYISLFNFLNNNNS